MLGAFLAASPVYNVIYLNGQVVRVTGVSQGAETTTLTLGAALAADVTPRTLISWCPLWRFAADRLEVSWRTNEVAEMTFALFSLPNGGGA